MGSHARLLKALLFFLLAQLTKGQISLRQSYGYWMNDINTFEAGTKAKFRVDLRDENGNSISASANEIAEISTQVENPAGQTISSLLVNIIANANGRSVMLEFTPETAGNFSLIVGDREGNRLQSSPFHFNVTSGEVFVPNCIAEWSNGDNYLQAGELTSLQVTLMDAFNNTVSVENGRAEFFEFAISVQGLAAEAEPFTNLSITSGDKSGDEFIFFVPVLAGNNFSLQVGSYNDSQISGSPFDYIVSAGPLSVPDCYAKWENGNIIKAGTITTLRIFFRDMFGNNVSTETGRLEAYNLDSYYVYSLEKPNLDLQINSSSHPGSGYQTLTFVPTSAGNFLLWVGNGSAKISESPLKFSVIGGPISIPNCEGVWSSNLNRFKAGHEASLFVVLKDRNGNNVTVEASNSLKFRVSVKGRVGDSKYISGVTVKATQGYQHVIVTFMAILAGSYSLYVRNGSEAIGNSPLPYSVFAGNISIHASVGSWHDEIDSCGPGEELKVLILLLDAFGNNLTETIGSEGRFSFKCNITNLNGTVTNISRCSTTFHEDSGYALVTFFANKTGQQYLWIGSDSETIYNSPLSFFVHQGMMSIENSYATWKYGVNKFQAFDVVKLYVHPRDKCGNPAKFSGPLDVVIFIQGRSDPSPFYDVFIQPSSLEIGAQLVTFKVTTADKFSLYIYNSSNGKLGGCPYNFSAFLGPVKPSNSIISGSGLKNSIAGEVSRFYVQLRDEQKQMAMAEVGSVNMIMKLGDTYEIRRSGKFVSNRTDMFEISYIANISGDYQIYVLLSNILLNKGIPFKKTVTPGDVRIGSSIVTGEGLKALRQSYVSYGISVMLKDKFGNPVYGKVNLLTLMISCNNTCKIDPFQENIKGTYNATYEAYNIGKITITIYYNNIPLPGSPYEVRIHSVGYFPSAMDDIFWTWEDTPVVVNLLSNDVVALGPKSMKQISKRTRYGELVTINGVIRYAPHPGYIGYDNFTYTLSDGRNETAIATATIRVMRSPPEIVSIPLMCLGWEDVPLPLQGESSGIRIEYSDPTSEIVVRVNATKGNIYIAAESYELWQSLSSLSEDVKSLNPAYLAEKGLLLKGTIDDMNQALDAMYYLGDQYFNGNDTITLTVIDEDGQGDNQTIPVTLKAINNMPFIRAPPMILYDRYDSSMLAAIGFNGEVTPFGNKPIIEVGDLDQHDTQWNDDVLTLQVMVEVDIGFITLVVPGNLTKNTETKERGSYFWAPISEALINRDFFNVSAVGVKFEAAIVDCNTILNNIQYSGTTNGVILTIKVNDMGSWGGSKDYVISPPYPLAIKKQIILVFQVPLPPTVAHREEKIVFTATLSTIVITGVLLVGTLIGISLLISKTISQGKEKIEKFIMEENSLSGSRVFNPLWVPSTPQSSPSHSSSHSLGSSTIKREPQISRLQEEEQELETLIKKIDTSIHT